MSERVKAKDPATGEERLMPALLPIPTQDSAGRWHFPDKEPEQGEGQLGELVDLLKTLLKGQQAPAGSGGGSSPPPPEVPVVPRTAFNPTTGQTAIFNDRVGQWEPMR